jgi:ABC-type glycerol-3-phosphate transport system substrate-binding protein
MPKKVVRVLQEDWAPLRNLYRGAQRFTQLTGIEVQVTLSTFPAFWTDLVETFTNDEPPFDLVGCDEMILKHYAHKQRIEPLDDYIAADGYSLADYQEAALFAASYDGKVYGLPHVFDPNVLIYRHDLFERYGFPIPQSMSELAETAIRLQDAVRRDGVHNFCGITLRGNAVESFMECGMTLATSWGTVWFDEAGRPTVDTLEHADALAFYVDLLKRAGPPRVADFGYEQSMTFYRSGRAGMAIMQISEAAIGIDRGGMVAEGTRVTVVPAGPKGDRCAGFYGPPYAIPITSLVKREAWELAKFLCSPEQLIHDAQRSAFIPVARKSLLQNEQFKSSFRPNLIETFSASIPFARPERPRSPFGAMVAVILSEAYHAALVGLKTPQEAVRDAQEKLSGLRVEEAKAF